MSSSNPTFSDMQHAVRDTVRLHWRLFLTQGVIMVILGLLAVIWPGISTIAVDVYVGWLFLLSGIVGLASMFLAPNVQAFLWMLLTAALSLFVGVMLWQFSRRPSRFLECGYAAPCGPVEKDGSHQRPRYRRSREAGQVWPDDRPYEGRLPHLGPRGVRLFQRGHRIAAF